jgi:hypothetical protein
MGKFNDWLVLREMIPQNTKSLSVMDRLKAAVQGAAKRTGASAKDALKQELDKTEKDLQKNPNAPPEEMVSLAAARDKLQGKQSQIDKQQKPGI